MSDQKDEKPINALAAFYGLVDKPGALFWIVYGLYALCAALFLLDFAYKKKTYFDIEYLPGFYALYGFFLCAALVVGAKAMRLVLKRREDYYAPMDVEAEDLPAEQMERLSHND